MYSHFCIIPPAAKTRHRGDVLEFDIKLAENLAVYQAIFHLHIRGAQWLDDPATNASGVRAQLLADARTVVHRGGQLPSIGLTLNRMLQQPQQQRVYTRLEADYKGEVPTSRGTTITFNVTALVQSWMTQRQQQQQQQATRARSVRRDQATTGNATIGGGGGGRSQEFVLKTAEPWMRVLLSLEAGSTYVSREIYMC